MILTPLLALCLAVILSAPTHARQILVVDLSQADAPTRMLVASIQGVVNRDLSEIGIYVVREPQDAAWLSLYDDDILEVAAGELADKARDRLAGQVLYDPAQEHSVNLAAAAAAVLDAALTTENLGLETLLDARGRWPDRMAAYRYAVAQVLPEGAQDRLALVGADRTDLRDYLSKERVLAVDLDWREPEQAALLGEILGRLAPGSLVLGSPEMAADDDLLAVLARGQHVLVPISQAPNLSFHSAHEATVPLRQLERVAPPAYQVMVTFVYEGGADLGHALRTMRALWQDPARGGVALGWTISPALLELAPVVMQSYSAGAWVSGTDELVLAPNGAGYFVPSRQGHWEQLVARMARWARAGDMRVAALADTGEAADLQRALVQYRRAGVRGILLGPGAKLASGLYGDMPVVAQSVRATDAYGALQAIRSAAKESKYIYVSVDPQSLTPTDIAHIATRLGERYVVLRPREFLEAARQTTAAGSQKPKEGDAVISDIALRPADPGPLEEVEVRATVRSATKVDSVWAAYSVAGAPGEWSALLKPGPDSRYAGALPPMLEGGRVSVRVRAVDATSGVTWSQPVSFEVPAPDADADGLGDAVERFLRTDRDDPDTDGDGWRDGNDNHPLAFDHFAADYVWPLVPPGDAPYIIDRGGSVADGIRIVEADEDLVYGLPLSGAPSGSRPVLHAVIGGDYRLEVSADGKQWQEIGSASGDVPLAPGGWEIPDDHLAAGSVRLRVSDNTPEGDAPARLAEVSVVANLAGPSISVAGTDPLYPAAGTPLHILADIYDPDGVAEARLHYRINGGGTIALPMREQDGSQTYAGEVHGARDGDDVTYWVTAVDEEGDAAASRRHGLHVGTVARETISLVAGRDFEGEWEIGAEWGASRWSPRKGATDSATINIIGGAYRVWVLAAPRAGGIRVSIDGQAVGVADALAPDGWRSLGTVDLARGKHEVSLASTAAARSGYVQVLITQDRRATPPPGTMRDLYNSITVLAPRPGEAVKGLVRIEATGTGNIGAVECYVDKARVGREDRSPYRFRWNARRAAAGPHSVELRALDHAGNLLLTTGLQVDVAK